MLNPQLVETIRQEFINRSAIAPDVFETAVEILPDITFDPHSHDCSTPLYDVLGWKYTRFTHSVKPTQWGACFKTESGEYWQAKVYGGENNGYRSGKYFAPKGIGDRPYLPPVPRRIVESIASRYGVEPPRFDLCFYDWLLANPQIDLTLHEGGKKVLSVMSVGEAALGLFGCLCGVDGETKLPKSDLLTKLYKNRKIYIALDRDTSHKALIAVMMGTSRLAKSIQICGGTPLILDWDALSGKGIDDVLANSPDPAATWQELKDLAKTFSQWRSRHEFLLTRAPDLQINADYLDATNCPLDLIPNKLIGLRSPHGTGKTTAVGQWVINQTNAGTPVIALTHYRSLERELSLKFGLPRRLDPRLDRIFGLTLCVDSLRDKSNGFNAPDWDNRAYPPVVVIEEATQLLNHLLFGTGTDIAKYRREILHQLSSLFAASRQIVLMDADLDDYTLRFFERLALSKAFVIDNQHSPGQFELTNFEHSSDALAQLFKRISAGEKIYLFSAAQKPDSRFGTTTIESILRSTFPDLKIGRLDSETIHDPYCEAYKHRDDWQGWLSTLDVAIASPSLSTGVSLDRYLPDCVFGFNSGAIAANDFLQSLWRVRSLCPRFIYCERSSANRIGNGSQSAQKVKAGSKLVSQAVQMFELFDFLQDDVEGDIFFDSWCEMAARANRTNANLRDTFLSLVGRQGHRIQSGDALDKQTRRRISQEWANGRAASALAWARRVDTAIELSSEEVKKLTESELKTQADRDALDKHKCLSRYGRVTPDLLLADRKGLYGRLQLAYYLNLPISSILERDKVALANLTESGKRKSLRTDINRVALSPKIQLLKRTRIDELLDYLRSLDFISNDDAFVKTIALTICSAKNLYADIFGIAIRDVEYNPNTGISQQSAIYIVNQVLSKLGYKLARVERVQANNVRYWHYRLIFFGCDQIYRFDYKGDRIPIIDVASIEADKRHIFSRWDKASLDPIEGRVIAA